MSDVLLCKQLTHDDSYILLRLSPSMQSQLKSCLLACIQLEDANMILKKLCDTIVELTSGILLDGGWLELLPFMFQYVAFDSPRLQESTLLMFAQLSQYIGEALIPRLNTLHSVFLQCLTLVQINVLKLDQMHCIFLFFFLKYFGYGFFEA